MAKQKRSEAQQARRFGIILAVLLAALGGWFFWKQRQTAALVAWAGGGSALFLSQVLSRLWLRLFRLWMKFAEILSWVMTRLILSAFFFLVLTPVAALMRLFGKRPLDLSFKDRRSTYWIDKPKGEYTLERYRKVF